jgi:hypothetical protein
VDETNERDIAVAGFDPCQEPHREPGA